MASPPQEWEGDVSGHGLPKTLPKVWFPLKRLARAFGVMTPLHGCVLARNARYVEIRRWSAVVAGSNHGASRPDRPRPATRGLCRL